MAEYLAPGVYVEEVGQGPPPIEGVATATAALLGTTGRGPIRPRLVTSLAQYERLYGQSGRYLPDAVRGFLANGGKRLFIVRLTRARGLAHGLAALDAEEEIALVAAPGLTDSASLAALVAHGEANRRFVVLDCPRSARGDFDARTIGASRDAAAYAPWLVVRGGPGTRRRVVPPSGHVLGLYARIDDARGVWKAPAGEALAGVLALDHAIDDNLQDRMAAHGIDTIRTFPGRGLLVWGARTLSSDDEWKYVNVRRLLHYLARSIDKGTQWVVFEPNGPSLWSKVRGQIENFLTALWRAGAFPAARPDQAFYVRCDESTMTQADIDAGRLVVEIGFAPLRPAEFVIFRIGQWTCEACR